MDHLTNLFDETCESLYSAGKQTTDVIWVGSRDGKFCITWEQFAAISNTEYDSGFGAPEVAQDLVVVGKDWWLERHEYDGAEEWHFKSMPIPAVDAKEFTKVTIRQGSTTACGWRSLSDLN